MLDYIEHGIFDALEKHYLKSFIFVVYLVRVYPIEVTMSV